MPNTSEQQVEPHTSSKDIGATLRRSARTKRSTIPSDYVVYLQESDYNIGAENDPESFSQAMSCKELELWYNTDSCPIGVSADSCPACSLIEGVINKIYNLLHHILG